MIDIDRIDIAVSEGIIKELSTHFKSFHSWKVQFSDLLNIYWPKMISLQRIIFPLLDFQSHNELQTYC